MDYFENRQNNMKKSLYEISTEAIELASMLEEGELTPELEKMLLINQGELERKGIDYAYAVKSMEGDIDTIDAEIKRLTALKNAKREAVQRMKESVCNAMNIYGFKSIKSPTLSLSVRRSEAIEVTNEEQLPDSFKKSKITVTPDKTRIKEAIKKGETVEGAVLNENFSLIIK